MMKALELTGQIFGRLTALYSGTSNSAGMIRWVCKCECGNTKEILGSCLINGHTGSCGCYHGTRLPYGEAAFNKCYGDYEKKCAGHRNYKWGLSKDQFRHITSANCYYCRQIPSNNMKSLSNGEYIFNGIDRINNDKGYTADNCVPCCFDCNKAKGTRSSKEFKEWSVRLYNNFGNKKD